MCKWIGFFSIFDQSDVWIYDEYHHFQDGCFTSDSDIFLFGARTVYREIILGEFLN